MGILGPLVEFWMDGGFDVMRHPISYYKLSMVVVGAKRGIRESIEGGNSLEDVAAVLAAKLPRIEELNKIYRGGEPLPLPAYMQSAEAWKNTPEEEKARQSFERDCHGPTRRWKTVNGLLSDLWRPLYDYGKAKGVDYEQVAQLVH